ncbi:Various environmental stresses-induced protein Ves [Soonwooa buanensis]|uniref:Various environmental stresses-induced protein Ves n=1 Tax=Soonwooa buanensis TaxID=619805 RepID=A0A1T5E578_9FLAO|nr:HutD family protein [Soonwooa buanensis]SKB79044.1 Various environmental stresses-induced protein Ves [Soonwooa buanensis]
MKYIKISKQHITPSIWDGGKTFEYFIYPPETNYAKRDFLFRISAASIEKEPSIFTRFENFQRFLVMLDNDLNIRRNDKIEHYSQQDVFVFDSNDEIVSHSLGNDFNVMVSKSVAFSKVEILTEFNHSIADFIFVFAKVETEIQLNNQKITLEVDDLLVIENLSQQEISVKSQQKIICSFIKI